MICLFIFSLPLIFLNSIAFGQGLSSSNGGGSVSNLGNKSTSSVTPTTITPAIPAITTPTTGPGSNPNPIVPGSPVPVGGPSAPNGPGGPGQQQILRQATQMIQQPQTSNTNQMPGAIQIPVIGQGSAVGGSSSITQSAGASIGRSDSRSQGAGSGQSNIASQPANFISVSPMQSSAANIAASGSQIINQGPVTGASFISTSPFGGN